MDLIDVIEIILQYLMAYYVSLALLVICDSKILVCITSLPICWLYYWMWNSFEIRYLHICIFACSVYGGIFGGVISDFLNKYSL